MKLKMRLLMTLFAASNLVANICVKNDTIWPIRVGVYIFGSPNFVLLGPIAPDPRGKDKTTVDLVRKAGGDADLFEKVAAESDRLSKIKEGDKTDADRSKEAENDAIAERLMKASTGDDLLNIKTGYRVDVFMPTKNNPTGEWENKIPTQNTSAPGHRFILVSFETINTKTGLGKLRIHDTPALTAAC